MTAHVERFEARTLPELFGKVVDWFLHHLYAKCQGPDVVIRFSWVDRMWHLNLFYEEGQE